MAARSTHFISITTTWQCTALLLNGSPCRPTCRSAYQTAREQTAQAGAHRVLSVLLRSVVRCGPLLLLILLPVLPLLPVGCLLLRSHCCILLLRHLPALPNPPAHTLKQGSANPEQRGGRQLSTQTEGQKYKLGSMLRTAGSTATCCVCAAPASSGCSGGSGGCASAGPWGGHPSALAP